MTAERGAPGRTPSPAAAAAPGRGPGDPPGRLPRGRRALLRLSSRGLAPAVSRVGWQPGLRVPAADGVILLADHYAPLDGGPWPTLLVRSPYGRGFPFSTAYGAWLAGQGFHVLLQSARGTGGSGGTLDPGRGEDSDGRAAVAWLREQDWFTGVLGTVGASYLGYVQWALASDPPPELRAMVIHNGLYDLGAFFWPGGALALEAALVGATGVLTFDRGFPALLRAFLRAQRRMKGLARVAPLTAAYPRVTGRRAAFIDEWLTRPEAADPYWADRRFPAAAGPGPAISQVTGWDDPCLDQTLEQHDRLGGRGRLLVGPWDHASTMDWPAVLTAGVAFLREHLGGAGGAPAAGTETLPGVRVHVGGPDGGWRVLPQWPPAGPTAAWHLHGDGTLAAAPGTAAVTSFRYDPADPTPAVGGQRLAGRAVGGRRRNNRLEARADVRVFTSAPLAAPLEVTGPVSARLEVSGDAECFDVFARLCDVDARGGSFNVCDGLVRVAGNPGQVTVAMSSAAYRFAAGHRLRLQVSGGAYPRFARSTGTAEAPGRAERLVPADIEIRHGGGSALLLPVAPG